MKYKTTRVTYRALGLTYKVTICFWFFPAARMACGMEPVPPAVEGQSLNHWIAREVPGYHFFTEMPL